MRRDVLETLKTLGIQGTPRGRELYARCPNRAAHANGDAHPSWHVVVDPRDPKAGVHHCWSCGFSGGLVGLAAAVWGIPRSEARARLGADVVVLPMVEPDVPEYAPGAGLVRRVRFSLPEGTVVPGDLDAMPPAFSAYLRSRGVTAASVRDWEVGYAERGRLAGRVVFPVRHRGELVAYSARAVDLRPWVRAAAAQLGLPELPPGAPMIAFARAADQVRRRHDTPTARAVAAWAASTRQVVEPRYLTPHPREGSSVGRYLYGADTAFGPSVTLVEGAMKAVLADQSGWDAPVATFGVALTPQRLMALQQFETVYVATDPNPAGEAAFEAVESLERWCRVVRVPLPAAPDDMNHGARVALWKRRDEWVASSVDHHDLPS